MAAHDNDGNHDSHGNSVAAWTGVTVITVAALVMSIAVVIASTPMFIVGAVLIVVGLVAGKLLAMAGFGVRSVSEGASEPRPGRSQVDSGIA